MSDVTLQEFEWIELDMPRCLLAYSIGLCTASLATGGGMECFNTRVTCQDPANYDQGILTLRFCKSQAFLPQDGNYYIPSLDSVAISAGSINPVGASNNSTALGTRGGISIRLADHKHTDKLVDPYVEARRDRIPTYNPVELGTFWTKWRARNPYYLNRVVRHCRGSIVGSEVVDVVTRTYFTSSFDGPSSGGDVSIQGRDILSQFANDKAKAPFASEGRLLDAIDEDDTSIELDTVGAGDAYSSSGVLRIGKELCDFTRTGDVFTIVRGRYRTTAASADAGDIVQLCLVYDGETPAFILEDLLSNYAAIPAEYLNLAQWAQEQTDYMPRLYSAIISDPTGVMDLVAEMCQQMYFYTIWDERNALLNIRAIRPSENDTVYQLSGFRNLVADSVTIRDLQEQLVTQVWVYYGLLNPTENAGEAKNYAAREKIISDEGGADKNGKESIKEIFCRWIPSTNGAAAIDLGQKMLARYRSVPRQVSFKLTNKDSAIWLGDFVSVDHRNSVDLFGNPLPLNIQVLSAQETKAGVEFTYTGQQFTFEAPVNPDDRLIIVSADELNINLRTLHDSIYAAPVGGEKVHFILRPGVNNGSGSTSDYAFRTGSWPADVYIYIEWLGIGAGAGGAGGGDSPNEAGEDGGPCWLIEYPVTANNQGTIGGGGGGGGARSGRGGGGGAGFIAGDGGAGSAKPGYPGSLFYGGDGGYTNPTLNGGKGGDLGGNGAQSSGVPNPGGDAGIAITGASLITWINKGDVRGAEIP